MSYQPLTTPLSIRTLTLHAGTLGPIQCNLKEVSLESAPYYEALSYVWGPPGSQQVVICDGIEMNITCKLYTALWRLRDATRKRVLWIDALCINQKDIDERSRQVNIMGGVYAGADNIIIWLGEEDPQTAAGWSLLEHLVAQSDAWDQGEGTNEMREQYRSNLEMVENSSWEALAGILSETWFERVWTLQEALANKGQRSEIHCGSFTMSWLDFYYSCHWIEFVGLGSKIGYIQYRVLDTDAYISMVDAGCFSWWRVFFLARQRKATDLKDKVYSLFGLLHMTEYALIKADYEKSLAEIYIEATLACIRHDQDLWILRACQEITHDNDLPTWVPDWRKSFAFPPLGGHIPEYNCDHNASLDHVPEVRLDMDNRSLDLFGTILFPLTDRTDKEALNLSTKSMKNACKEILQRFTLTDIYHGKDNTESVIAQTLMGGIKDLIKLGQADPGTYDAILSWHEDGLTSPIPEAADLELSKLLSAKTSGRCLFTSTTREHVYIGLAPDTARLGDVICIFHGSGVPFVLRAIDDNNYRLVGDCYVHGMMNGEVFGNDWPGQNWTYITLV